jgi:hypothetical protein
LAPSPEARGVVVSRDTGRLAGTTRHGPRSLLSYRYILPDHLSVRMIGDGLFVYTNDRMETITQVPGHFHDGLG